MDTRFELSKRSSKFMCRWGAGNPDHSKTLGSNKKLCFVATDRGLLAETLYDLSLRTDCHAVKFSTRARDGMYLGRCFLTTEGAVGRLWRDFKGHPRLLCSVQDDEFVAPFRASRRDG